MEVALDIVIEVVVDRVLIRESADLCNEIDIFAVLTRPCAINAEVAFLVFAIAFVTDAFSGSDEADEKVAKSLAQRFEYRGDAANIVKQNVNGLGLGVTIGDGITKSTKRYAMLLNTNGTADGVIDIAKTEYGDYETKLMSGVKSAMTASTMAWRAEANDLMKRMGDLRLSPEDEGVWARVYRGKSSSNKDKTDFQMNYTTIQVGYDKKVGDDWRVGIAGS